jgi:hypothetical protein
MHEPEGRLKRRKVCETKEKECLIRGCLGRALDSHDPQGVPVHARSSSTAVPPKRPALQETGDPELVIILLQ